jgi:hypothetical protein
VDTKVLRHAPVVFTYFFLTNHLVPDTQGCGQHVPLRSGRGTGGTRQGRQHLARPDGQHRSRPLRWQVPGLVVFLFSFFFVFIISFIFPFFV